MVGVVRGSERDLLCLGSSTLKSGRPPGGDSLFAIGSITKTFTGILLADMVARGEVALSDSGPSSPAGRSDAAGRAGP